MLGSGGEALVYLGTYNRKTVVIRVARLSDGRGRTMETEAMKVADSPHSPSLLASSES